MLLFIYYLEKLQKLSIGGNLLVWVREFFIGLTTRVKIAGNMSSLKDVSSGVSQGFVLGPLLFLNYVNHIASSVGCCWKAFTDDFKLYLSFPRNSCISILQDTINLQTDLNKVCEIAKS